jgi:translation initiation factor 5A
MQLDITDDGFLSLMKDDGDTKDDVKLPEGEVGERLMKMFKEEEKDVSKYFALSLLWPSI